MSTNSVMRAWVIALALAVGLAGCGDDGKKKVKILTEPADATVVVGATASFTVAANSDKVTYQWRRNGVDIAMATGATYTTAATVAGDSGAKFSVVVTRGKKTATSREATLIVNTQVAITAQPLGATALVGATASFAVTATGTAPLSYQWRKNGTAIGGATSASYTTPALVIEDNGAVYSVVVTNPAGSVTSSNATLTVQAPDSTPVAWDPNLVVATGDVYDPSAAMDDSGNGYGVYLNVNSRVLATKGSIGGTWSAGQFVDVGGEIVGNIGAFAPQVAVNPAGKGVLAFGYFTGGFASHVAVAIGDSGTWGTPTRIWDNISSDTLAAGIDDTGRSIVVWGGSLSNSKIMAAVFNGTTWTAPVALGINPNSGSQPTVAIDGSGKGQLVYIDNYDIVAIPVDLSLVQPFGTPVTAATISTFAADVRVAVDQLGGAVVIVYESVAVGYDVVAINLRPGTGWSPRVSIGVDVPFFPRDLTVASDEAGNAIAAWAVQVQTVPDGPFRDTVHSSTYTPAGGWTAAELRPNVTADDVEGIQIAASRTGRFALGWVQSDSGTGNRQVWAQVYEGGAWKTAGQVQTTTRDALFGSTPLPNRPLAMAANGDGLLFWVEQDATDNALNTITGAFLQQ